MSAVSGSFRARVRSGVEPIAALFGKVGLTPNALTLIGFGIAIVGAWLAATEAWLLAGIVVALGAIFDLFDGALARTIGKTTQFGAFLDSTMDRAGEAVVYIGIAVGALASRLDTVALGALCAMAAGFMVSYTRAKSESQGFSSGSGMASVGLAPREVRMAILVIGLLLGGSGALQLVPPPGSVCIDQCIYPGGLALTVTIWLIAILATITTIQRILFVQRQSKSAEVNH